MQVLIFGPRVHDQSGYRLLEPAVPAPFINPFQIRMEVHGAARCVGDVPSLVKRRTSPETVSEPIGQNRNDVSIALAGGGVRAARSLECERLGSRRYFVRGGVEVGTIDGDEPDGCWKRDVSSCRRRGP